MQIVTTRLLVIGTSLLALSAAWAQEPKGKEQAGAAAQKNAEPAAVAAKVGQAAPDFTLLDCAGKKQHLADYKDKLVVLEWLNQQCPFSVKAVPIMKELRKKYADKDVLWLGIESTHYRTPEENLQYIKDKELNFPILMDNDGKVGRLYGAKVTPHMFVINKGELVYAGALYSTPEGGDKEAVGRNYVDETLAALLAGKPVPVAETTPKGCNVKYKPAAEEQKGDKPADEKKAK
jgi:peroxiredoxin